MIHSAPHSYHFSRRGAKLFTLTVIASVLSQWLPSVYAQDETELTAALNASQRDVAHLLRDATRRPLEILDFVGIAPGMQVLDVYAADGYYSYILSRAVGAQGKVYAQNPPANANIEDIRQMSSLADALDQRIAIANLDNVVHLREDFFDLSIPANSLDAIMLVQILHDFYNADSNYAARGLMALTALLKPGGIIAIIDHAGDAGQDNARLHRMRKLDAIATAERAGLQLVGDSELLSNPQDRRRRPVFDPMLGRNTDRFVLKFQKPAGN